MSAADYAIIEIYTSEEDRHRGHPLYEAVAHLVAKEDSHARCLVTRAVAGCFENGRIASHRVLDLSYNMPLKIEVLLPASDVDSLLPKIQEMVTDGIIAVRHQQVDVRLSKQSPAAP